jgi:hypothetical protein
MIFFFVTQHYLILIYIPIPLWKHCTETKDWSLSMACYVHVLLYNAEKQMFTLHNFRD